MPSYDFRCKACGHGFSQFYKSYRDYDPAARRECPQCGSAEVERRIERVNIPRQGRDLSRLSANEMLSVLDSGQSKDVGRMFQQVAESTGADPGATYTEATERLLKGESIPNVEKALSDKAAPPPPAPAKP
jgi:putative FmdB family regulatory protein